MDDELIDSAPSEPFRVHVSVVDQGEWVALFFIGDAPQSFNLESSGTSDR